jgi:hypothetical protein
MKILTGFVTNHRLVLLAIILLALVMYLINFNFAQVGVFSDDAAYIILAKSIATGQGYARINFPTPRPEVAWPMGYPLLLSPLVAIWPFNFVPLKLLSLILTFISIFILWKYLQFRISPGYAVIIIALYALNDDIANRASFVMAEPAYMVWSLLCLYLFHKFETDKFSKWYQMWLIALILVLTSITRLIGVSLAIATILMLLWQRNLRAAIIIGVLYSVGMLPQFMLGRLAGGELFPPEVAAQVDVSTNYVKILPNFQEYFFTHIPNVAFGTFGQSTYAIASRFHLGWLVLLIQLSLLFLIVLGLWRSVKNGITLGEIYLGVYFAVLCVKTWDGIQDTTPRYLIPLLPLIYLYLIQGIDRLAGWLANRFSRPLLVPATLACIIIPSLLLLCVRNVRNAFHPFAATDLTAGATWLADHTEQDAIIMSFLPVHHYLYARRHTTYFPLVKTEEEFFTELDRQHISYLLVGPAIDIRHTPTPEIEPLVLRLRQFLDEHPERFQRVYEDDRALVVVYQVVPKS